MKLALALVLTLAVLASCKKNKNKEENGKASNSASHEGGKGSHERGDKGCKGGCLGGIAQTLKKWKQALKKDSTLNAAVVAAFDAEIGRAHV